MRDFAYENLCFRCMQELDMPGEICKKCGYDNRVRTNEPGFLPPTVLKDQYCVGMAMGRGGFGITYIGYDRNLCRRVAIKEYFPAGLAHRMGTERESAFSIRPYNDSREDFLRGLNRTLQESQIVAQMGRVNNVVQVYNAFEENGTAYIVMEYIQGKTLSALVKEGGPMEWERAYDLLRPIMQALESIHAKGIIHRDVSPENIMLDGETGETMLLDFGAAHQYVDIESGHTRSLRPGYAPKEQYSSITTQDGRTDEYAVCATFYYLVTGRTPPEADMLDCEVAHLQAPIQSGAKITEAAQRVLLKGMSVRIEDRYESMAELIAAFDAARKIKDDDNGGGKRWKWWAAGAGVLALVAVLIVVLFFGGDGSDPIDPVDAESTVETVLAATEAPTEVPTEVPTEEPTEVPTEAPAETPTEAPTEVPTEAPTEVPTEIPTEVPTETPTEVPTEAPTQAPTPEPTEAVDPAMAALLPPEGASNELMSDYVAAIEREDGTFAYAGTVLGSEIARADVRTVRFVDNFDEIPAEGSWDVSATGEGGVRAWVTERDGMYDLTIAGIGGVRAGEKILALFRGYTNMESIDFGGAFDTSATKDMGWLFEGCERLTSMRFDLDTSSLEYMTSLFHDCASLTEVTLDIDSPNLQGIASMFSDCVNLKRVDLGSMETARIREMSYAFAGCWALEGLDLSGKDFSCVAEMDATFAGCESLTELDLSGFNGSYLYTMAETFSGCGSLAALDLSGMNTSGVTNMAFLFNNCERLSELNLSNLNTAKVANMAGMFSGCSALESLDLSSFDTSQVGDFGFMFNGCESLTELNLENFDTSKAVDMSGMFQNCKRLEALDLTGFEVREDANMQYMFFNTPNLRAIDAGEGLRGRDGGDGMFDGCAAGGFTFREDAPETPANLLMYDSGKEYFDEDDQLIYYGTVLGSEIPREAVRTVRFVDSLADAPEDSWNVSGGGMFDVRAWVVEHDGMYDLTIGAEGGVKSGVRADGLFKGYVNVESIDFGGAFDTSGCQFMFAFFDGCQSLRELNFDLDTSSVENMTFMFRNCESLEELDLTGADASGATDMGGMFENTPNLRVIFAGEGLRGRDQNESMFEGSGVDGFTFGDEEPGNCLRENPGLEYFKDDKLSYGGTVLGSAISRESVRSVRFVDSLADAPEDSWDVSADGRGGVRAWAVESDGMYDLTIGAEGGVRAGESADGLFKGYVNMESIDFGGAFDTSGCQSMFAFLDGCRSLRELHFDLDTSSVVNMALMFRNCESLEGLLLDIDTGSARQMEYMFQGDGSLRTLDISRFDTSGVEDFRGMFWGCYSLETLYLANFNTDRATEMSEMFRDMENLRRLDIASFDTENVINFDFMFAETPNLTELVLGDGFVIREGADTDGMFDECAVAPEEILGQ